jgi:hypothetical protein
MEFKVSIWTRRSRFLKELDKRDLLKMSKRDVIYT